MANTRITDLTAYTDPATTDVLPIVDVGADTTKKVSVGEIVSKITGDIDVDATGTAAISAGAIVNADVNASAAIAGTKISPNFGAQTIQTTGVFSIPLGSAGAPSVAVTGDPNTGIYSPGADQVAISTGGTQRLHIDSGGNIGLNVAAGGAAGFGGFVKYKGTASPGFFLENGPGDSWWGVYGGNSAADGTAIVYPSTGSLRIATSTNVGVGGFSERLRITSAGNVGIGTSAPSAPLDVVGTIKSSTTVSAASDFRLNNFSYSRVAHSNGVGGFVGGYNVKFSSGVKHDSTGSLSATYHSNDGTVRIYTSGSQAADAAAPERLIVTDTGRVGIGTSTPNAGLTISQNAAGAGTNGQLAFGDIGPGTPNARIDGYRTGGSYAGELHFYTTVSAGTVTRAVTIDASQRMGIGTASPSYTLDVAGSTSAARIGKLNILDDAPFVTGANLAASSNFAIGTQTASSTLFYTNNTERARIDSSGRLLVGTSSARANFYNTSISSRLQVEGANDGNSRAISCVYGQSNASGPILILGKHRSDSLGGTTVVSNDDEIGALTFQGSDGTEFVAGAQITAYVDGTPGANDMPGRLVFSTTADGSASPTERLRITSTGQVRLAGAGITFNGDTATANELDDYEEGTFTPTVSGGSTAGTGTYSTQAGKYVKIGGMVFAEVGLQWSAHTGTGNMFLTGLPFTSAANEAGSGISVGRANNLAIAANSYLTGYIIASNTAVALRAIPTGGGAESSVTLDTAAAINYSITYMVV